MLDGIFSEGELTKAMLDCVGRSTVNCRWVHQKVGVESFRDSSGDIRVHSILFYQLRDWNAGINWRPCLFGSIDRCARSMHKKGMPDMVSRKCLRLNPTPNGILWSACDVRGVLELTWGDVLEYCGWDVRVYPVLLEKPGCWNTGLHQTFYETDLYGGAKLGSLVECEDIVLVNIFN